MGTAVSGTMSSHVHFAGTTYNSTSPPIWNNTWSSVQERPAVGGTPEEKKPVWRIIWFW